MRNRREAIQELVEWIASGEVVERRSLREGVGLFLFLGGFFSLGLLLLA
jgi:hypothetical protein